MEAMEQLLGDVKADVREMRSLSLTHTSTLAMLSEALRTLQTSITAHTSSEEDQWRRIDSLEKAVLRLNTTLRTAWIAGTTLGAVLGYMIEMTVRLFK